MSRSDGSKTPDQETPLVVNDARDESVRTRTQQMKDGALNFASSVVQFVANNPRKLIGGMTLAMIAAAEVCNGSQSEMGACCRAVNSNPHLGATVGAALFGLGMERAVKAYEDHYTPTPMAR